MQVQIPLTNHACNRIKDLLGTSFGTMISNLTDMVRMITDNANQLVTAANEVASSSEEMSHDANNLCAHLNFLHDQRTN